MEENAGKGGEMKPAPHLSQAKKSDVQVRDGLEKDKTIVREDEVAGRPDPNASTTRGRKLKMLSKKIRYRKLSDIPPDPDNTFEMMEFESLQSILIFVQQQYHPEEINFVNHGMIQNEYKRLKTEDQF